METVPGYLVAQHDLIDIVHRLHEIRVRRIGVVAQAQRADYRQAVPNGYRHGSLQTVVALVDAAHGEVRERTARIVVERNDLRLVRDRRIVTRHTRLDIRQVEIIGQIHAEDLLGLQARSRRVARTRRHESRGEFRSLLHHGDVRLERVGTRELVTEVALGRVGQVLELLRIALRVVGEEPLAPQSLTVHRRIAQLSGNSHREAALAPRIERPGIALEQVRPVVVAELVAFTGNAGMARSLVVVQIVLRGRRTRHVALGELVDIVPVVAAHEVLDLVVIPGAVHAQVHTAEDAHVVAHLMLDAGGEVVVELVRMALLEDVVRTVMRTRILLETRHVLQLGVDILVLAVEIIEIEHTCPGCSALEVLLHVEEEGLIGTLARNVLTESVRRQIAVVVAAGIRTAVPCQRRVAVLTETQRRGGIQARTLRHVPGIGQHCNRLVHVAYARVAQLAGLVTHIGVVVVVAEEAVSLVGRSLLRSALRRRRHDRQTQTVVVAEEFLGRSKVGVGIVVNTVHIAVAALARTEREGIRPAVVQLSRSIGNHCTETVELVGIRNAHTEALAHLRGPRVDVRHAADTAHTVIHHLKARDVLLVAGGVVQTAPQRPGTITRHGIVETDAVEHDVRILRIETADVETHLTEAVRGDIAEKILRRGELAGKRLHVRIGFVVRLDKDGAIDRIERSERRNDHRLDILDEIVAHADHQFEIFILGSRELDHILTCRQILKKEAALPVRRGRKTQRLDGYLHVAHGRTSVARNDLAADTAILRIGSGRCGNEHQK